MTFMDPEMRRQKPVQLRAMPPTPDELPAPGQRWSLRSGMLKAARSWGLRADATAPLTVDIVGGTNVYAHTETGFRGVLSIRQLLTFWQREVSDGTA